MIEEESFNQFKDNVELIVNGKRILIVQSRQLLRCGLRTVEHHAEHVVIVGGKRAETALITIARKLVMRCHRLSE